MDASRILENSDKDASLDEATSLKGDAALLKGDTPRAPQPVLKSWTDPNHIDYLVPTLDNYQVR